MTASTHITVPASNPLVKNQADPNAYSFPKIARFVPGRDAIRSERRAIPFERDANHSSRGAIRLFA
jgi:hypothetical protein